MIKSRLQLKPTTLIASMNATLINGVPFEGPDRLGAWYQGLSTKTGGSVETRG